MDDASPAPAIDAAEDAAEDDEARRARVGEELRLAFVALGSPAVPDEDRPRLHQRLIAITNSSKHDLPTAESRLARWWADYESEVGPRPTP